jgi:hypothetical protein
MRTVGQITTQLIRPSAQWHWLSDKMQCRAGEAPAEPHPCRERFFNPRCAAKTLANAHSADQRSAARQEPRPPRSSPVFSQNFRESQCHWPSAGRTTATCHQQPEAFRFVRQASSVGLRGLRRLQIPGSLKKRRSADFDFAKTAGWLQVRGLIAGAFPPKAPAFQELPIGIEVCRLSKKS